MSYDERVMQNNSYLHSSWVISGHSSCSPITKQFHHPVPIPVEDHGVPVPPHSRGGGPVHHAGDDGLLPEAAVDEALVHLNLRLVWIEAELLVDLDILSVTCWPFNFILSEQIQNRDCKYDVKYQNYIHQGTRRTKVFHLWMNEIKKYSLSPKKYPKYIF